MSNVATVLVLITALLHLYFFYLESVLWTKPYGLKKFKMTPEKAQITRPLAVNQGLYNGFLAAGLIWGVIHPDPSMRHEIQLFFASCVLIAGVVGGLTASKGIFFVQAIPGLLTTIFVLLS
jgi:putative membrane protein